MALKTSWLKTLKTKSPRVRPPKPLFFSHFFANANALVSCESPFGISASCRDSISGCYNAQSDVFPPRYVPGIAIL